MSIVPSASTGVDGPSGGNISDVVGLILDKGLVIDVFARVSLVGIEILTVDARIVVASVDTYLRFAEAANRLNLEATRKPGLPELLQGVTGAVGAVTGAGSRPAPPALDDGARTPQPQAPPALDEGTPTAPVSLVPRPQEGQQR
jgi:hypothetical protein